MPGKKSDSIRNKQATSNVRKAGKRAGRKKNGSAVGTKGSFPIVGIGASAGGLEAFEQFFTHMPPDTGIAFVLI